MVGSWCPRCPSPAAVSAMASVLVVDGVDCSVVGVVMVKKGMDVSLNDEEASSEVLEADEEDEDEDEDEGSEQQQPSEQGVLERAVAERKYGWLEERNGGSRYR